jgi:CHAD domain-containing protein
MSHFSLMPRESPGTAFRRVTSEQIEQAVALCSASAGDPDRASHEIRKCTKRLRSLIKLYRDALPAHPAASEISRFRDISSLLASHRASRVHLDMLESVAAEKHPGADPFRISRLHEQLAGDHAVLTRNMLQKGSFAVVQQRFEASLLPGMPVPVPCTFTGLSRQIAASQRACRRNLKVLMASDTAEAMHELRKSVKTLWYQLTLVHAVWPAVVGATVHQLDLLAEKLGRDHDLHELTEFLIRMEADSPGKVPEGLIAHLLKKRGMLRKPILTQAARLFTEKPSHLARRLEGYYRVFTRQG